MSTSIPIISLTPTNCATEIPVITPSLLPSPYDVGAVYSRSTKIFTASATVSVPVEVGSSDISLYQFFDSSKPSDLQFYFVYDLEGPESGNFHDFIFEFTALDVDCHGNAIDLSKITTMFSLTKDLDPKTSRGTVTTVRVSSDVE